MQAVLKQDDNDNCRSILQKPGIGDEEGTLIDVGVVGLLAHKKEVDVL
jgi:hypothetical protein